MHGSRLLCLHVANSKIFIGVHCIGGASPIVPKRYPDVHGPFSIILNLQFFLQWINLIVGELYMYEIHYAQVSYPHS